MTKWRLKLFGVKRRAIWLTACLCQPVSKPPDTGGNRRGNAGGCG